MPRNTPLELPIISVSPVVINVNNISVVKSVTASAPIPTAFAKPLDIFVAAAFKYAISPTLLAAAPRPIPATVQNNSKPVCLIHSE